MNGLIFIAVGVLIGYYGGDYWRKYQEKRVKAENEVKEFEQWKKQRKQKNYQ